MIVLNEELLLLGTVGLLVVLSELLLHHERTLVLLLVVRLLLHYIETLHGVLSRCYLLDVHHASLAELCVCLRVESGRGVRLLLSHIVLLRQMLRVETQLRCKLISLYRCLIRGFWTGLD